MSIVLSSSTPSLCGGRAHVDLLDLCAPAERIRRRTGPDDRLCHRRACDWPRCTRWGEQRRREGAGKVKGGVRNQPLVTHMSHLFTQRGTAFHGRGYRVASYDGADDKGLHRRIAFMIAFCQLQDAPLLGNRSSLLPVGQPVRHRSIRSAREYARGHCEAAGARGRTQPRQSRRQGSYSILLYDYVTAIWDPRRGRATSGPWTGPTASDRPSCEWSSCKGYLM